MDHGLTAHNQKGRTDLHFVNDLIADVMKLHSTIERSHRARKEKKLTDTSKRLYHLHKNISERRVPQPRELVIRKNSLSFREN
jgi:hypothetical protein